MSRPAWLVAVDLQQVFADQASEWRVPRFAEAADNVERLARALPERSVLTRFVAPERPVGAWERYYEQYAFALRPADDRLFDLDGRLAAYASRTLTATTFGKWTAELREMVGERPRLLVCGVATDCCVLSTVLPAADAGAEVTVVTDACAGSSDEAHEKALAVMGLYAPLVTLATTTEVLASLG